MLVELLVENFAVADRVRIRLHAGLNVLSGETGSGKSLIVDSLGLLFGGRASTEVIRSGAERARISGIFEVPKTGEVEAVLESTGLESEDGELLIEREIQANGKSRAFVGSRPVSVGILKQLQPLLGDIHGQHDQQRLFDRGEQLAMLDEFAGNADLLAQVRETFGRWRETRGELAALEQREQEMLRQQDVWRFQADEIEAAGLRAGEDVSLEQELRVLANVVKLKEQAAGALGMLDDSPDAAITQVSLAVKRLGELRRIDESLDGILEVLRAAELGLKDAALELTRYVDRLEADPGRLGAVEARLGEIDKLRRKYGHTVDEVLAYWEKLRADLEVVEHGSERRAQLKAEVVRLEGEFGELAGKLRKRRREGELKDLNMARTKFSVELADTEWSASGTDAVEFLIATNLGEEPRPLAKVASGGELSRLALALKVALAAKGSRTLVFDEVDAGIGGSAAEQVGRKLRALSKGNQLICVTHLAQIAAFADHHFAVEKREAAGRTHSVVTEMEGEERVKEVARMIGGQRLTEEAKRYAGQLLEMGAER
jgi:DNA repair protein RecN (Recombination protein N)